MLTIQNNQLTFIDGRFYIAEDGSYYPSATTILEAYPKPYALLEWMKTAGNKADEIRDEAGRRGSTVHRLSEAYDKGHEVSLLSEDGTPAYSLDEWAMFERYVNYSEAMAPINLNIEETLICPLLGFGGTLDRVAIIDGKTHLIDIKTSNGVYPSYWLQLAAYRQALRINLKLDVDFVSILWLNAKTRTERKGQGVGWQLISQPDTTSEWDLFQSVQKLWVAENKNARPKNFSYNLKHKKNVQTKETSNI
jgi:hypothetical protein